MYHKRLGVPIESGISSGCPFCQATMRKDKPKVGDIIRILKGYDSGRVARVIAYPNNRPHSESELFIMFEDCCPRQYRILDIIDELFDYIPLPPVPDWAPPICLQYAEELESVVMRFWVKSLREDGSLEPIPAFFEIIK